MKKSFMDSIGDEKLAEMIDATFNYEKRGGVMRVGLLKMLPAVAAILLVIGLANFLPMISFGGDYGITPGATLELEPVVAEADCEQVVEADCEYIADDTALQAFMDELHRNREKLVENIPVTWTWARTDENGGVTILRGRDHEPEWVTLAELDAIIHDIDNLAVKSIDSVTEAIEMGWPENENISFGYSVAVFSPERETVGLGIGTSCYESLLEGVRLMLNSEVAVGTLTREEADFYIAEVAQRAAAIAYP